MQWRDVVRGALVLVSLLGGAGARPAWAQDGTQLAPRAPRFLVVRTPSAKPIVVDAHSVAALRRRITVDLNGVTLETALTRISSAAGLRIMYSKSVLSLNDRVQLRASDITVAAALMAVLLDANVDVLLTANGQAVLSKRERSVVDPAQQLGTVVGRVTDVKTGEPLVGAEILLDGTRTRGTSGEKGYYRLADVEAGSYILTVRRVGYARQSRTVTVTASQELTVDVALQPVVTQLNEIVTTVTGEQRRLELGHVVGVINADSVMKEAPVSSLSELLTGRVPGLQVSQGQGTVGGAVKLQIRGQNSLLLKNEPIVVIDGVRYASDAVPHVLYGGGPAETERTSPLNDLNPNDIESVEVVKGPSAATLYGTDASNGVIVIRTKRGRPGPARWNAYGKGSRTTLPDYNYPDNYWGWGTAFGVANKYNCSLELVVAGYCTQDSVTVIPNPLNDPRWTIFGSAPRYEYGMNVSGGRQDVRYYFSLGLENAMGPVRMPEASIERLEQKRGTALSEEFLHPNTLDNVNLRANIAASLGDEGEVTINGGYIRGNIRTLATVNPYTLGVAAGDPYDSYGTRYGSRPEDIFAGQSTEHTDRFVGSAIAQWRPRAWLSTRGTVGLDIGARNRGSLLRRGDAPGSDHPYGTTGDYITGTVTDDRAREVATTADLNVTATWRRRSLSARTSVGVQYVRTLTDVLASAGNDLPPGGTSIGEAAWVTTRRSYAERVTLGSYVEETFGFNDRLFFTGAVRIDGASAFGRNYNATAYPKLGVSWLASQEPFFPRIPGLDELRFRYAYGSSGQQPQPNVSRPQYGPRRGFVNGALVTVIGLTGIGNPDLRPERVREHEVGFDLTGLRGRLQLGLTWYKRKTIDQIGSLPLPAGYGSIQTNLGLTAQHGFELELVAHLVDSRAFSWDMIAQHSLHRTKLVDLGGATETRSLNGGYVEGYSLGARFRATYEYADTNGNGTIDGYPYDEVTYGPDVYAGESTPPSVQTMTAMFGFLDRRMRVSTLFERRAGFTQVNTLKDVQCAYIHRCRGLVDPTTPLAEQAAASATTRSSYLERGDFTRLREVSVALDLPATVARAMHMGSATVSVSARNVALWTDFTGGDPESAEKDVNSNGTGGIPQGRTWTLRLDLGF